MVLRFPSWAFPDAIELTLATDAEGKQAVTIADYNGNIVVSAEGVNLDAGNAGLVSRTLRGPIDLPIALIDPELNETTLGYEADGLLSWTQDANRGRTELA